MNEDIIECKWTIYAAIREPHPHGDRIEPMRVTGPALAEGEEVDVVPTGQLTKVGKDLERARGVLTLWANLAPAELLNYAPGPNGKTLAELTHESFGEQS